MGFEKNLNNADANPNSAEMWTANIQYEKELAADVDEIKSIEDMVRVLLAALDDVPAVINADASLHQELGVIDSKLLDETTLTSAIGTLTNSIDTGFVSIGSVQDQLPEQFIDRLRTLGVLGESGSDDELGEPPRNPNMTTDSIN